MCYDDNARPPYPPISGAAMAADGADVVLTAADGNQFAAYMAQPHGPARALMLIYPDVRGLHQFYKDLALRFAEIGVAAIAMDYFGRTAGLTSRADGFEYMPHVQQLKLEGVFADAQASLAHLRAAAGTRPSPSARFAEGIAAPAAVQGAGSPLPAGTDKPSFLVGFCMGGSLTIQTGVEGFGLAGVIPFYAGMSRAFGGGKGTALDAAPGMKVPLLGFFGGADQGIPVEQVHALDAALDKSGAEHEVVIYPGAPHSFFDRRATDFAEASTDAWKRMLGFIAAHGGK
jgi:carboxymethylenebutenolidase